MYKDKIIYVSKGELFDYFNEICELYKNMYNTANYYIRNTMTGIKKSPEKRFPNETEVLHHVFTNISNINKIKLKTYNKKLEKTDSEDIKIQKVDYPTRDKWFLSYGTLDGIFKLSENESYINMPSQLNQNNIDTIVVGKNNLWKQEINIGNKNNQNFCYIPFEIFNNQLKYLTKENNINLFFVDESYTSKASLLNFDAVPTYKKGNSNKYSFSCKRIHRGIYKTNEGILMNADINGASNILRKQFSSAFNDIMDFNYLLQPISWWDIKYYKKTTVQQVKTV